MITINAVEFAAALNRVVPFASSDDARPVLQGVLFSVKNNTLSMVAADGFRLSLAKFQVESSDDAAIIPAELLKPYMKASKKSAPVSIEYYRDADTEGTAWDKHANGKTYARKTSVRHFGIIVNGTKLASIDATYPDYNVIIPAKKNTKTEVSAKADDFKTHFSAMHTIARAMCYNENKGKTKTGDSKVLQLYARPDGITAIVNSPEIGQARRDWSVKHSGPALGIAFSSRFVAEAFEYATGDVTIRFSANAPVRIDYENITTVLMPMRNPDGWNSEPPAIVEPETKPGLTASDLFGKSDCKKYSDTDWKRYQENWQPAPDLTTTGENEYIVTEIHAEKIDEMTPEKRDANGSVVFNERHDTAQISMVVTVVSKLVETKTTETHAAPDAVAIPDPAAEIHAKYAWIERWEADPKKRWYKSTIANGKVNLAAELAALEAIDVTSEFKTLNQQKVSAK